MDEFTVNLPERLDRKVTFGVYTIEDLMRGSLFLIVFIGFAILIGNLALGILFSIIGLILFWLFGLTKVDGMDFMAYLQLKMGHGAPPMLGVSTLKVYDNGVVHNGRYWFKIVEVTATLSLDFMSDEDKIYVFSQFQHMLNSAPFSMQFIVHSWDVDEDAFDEYVNGDGELARGYRRLLREHTKNLYLQSYYILPIATKKDVKGTTEAMRWKNAERVLDIYVDTLTKSLKSLGLDSRVLTKPSEIYGVITEVLR